MRPRTSRTCTLDPLSHQSPHEAGTVLAPVGSPKGMDLQQRGGQWQILAMKCSDKVEGNSGEMQSFLQEPSKCCCLKWHSGGGLLFKQALKLTTLGSVQPWRWVAEALPLWHSVLWHLMREIFDGKPLSCLGEEAPSLQEATTAPPIREASGKKSKPRLSQYFCS